MGVLEDLLERPERDSLRSGAVTQLGIGLNAAGHYADALSVMEAELSMSLGSPEHSILVTQSNLARTYRMLERFEEALRVRQDVYSRILKLHGEQHRDTLEEANNYATSLGELQRYAEAKSLLGKAMPRARRVFGDNSETTLRLRWTYAQTLYKDTGATLDDLREAVSTLEETAQTAKCVLGGAHPLATAIADALEKSRAALRSRKTQPPSGSA